MSVEIRVPSLGELVTEATVAKWFKQVGDQVTADEPIVELETDKVTLEFNAPANGTLAQVFVDEGGEVEVGALIGAIDEFGADHQSGAQTAAPAAVATSGTAPASASTEADPGTSPAVRKLLAEHGLDPATIAPSGPKGNLTKADVLAAIEAGARPAAVAPAPAAPPLTAVAPAAAEPSSAATETPRPTPQPAAPAAAAAPASPVPAPVAGHGSAPAGRSG